MVFKVVLLLLSFFVFFQLNFEINCGDIIFCPSNFSFVNITSNSNVYLKTCCNGTLQYTISEMQTFQSFENVTFFGMSHEGDSTCDDKEEVVNMFFNSQFEIIESFDITFNATEFRFDLTNTQKINIQNSQVYFYGHINFNKSTSDLCPIFDISDSSYVYLEDPNFIPSGNCGSQTSPLILIEDSEIEADSITHNSIFVLTMSNPTINNSHSRIKFPSGSPINMQIHIKNLQDLDIAEKNIITIESEVPIQNLSIMGDLLDIRSNFTSIDFNNSALQVDLDNFYQIDTASFSQTSTLIGEGELEILSLHLEQNSVLVSNISLSVESASAFMNTTLQIKNSTFINNLIMNEELEIKIDDGVFHLSNSSQNIDLVTFIGNSIFEADNKMQISHIQTAADYGKLSGGIFEVSEITSGSNFYLENTLFLINSSNSNSIVNLTLSNSEFKNDIGTVSISNVFCLDDCEFYSTTLMYITSLTSDSSVTLNGPFSISSSLNCSNITIKNSTLNFAAGTIFWKTLSEFNAFNSTLNLLNSFNVTNFYSNNSTFISQNTNLDQISITNGELIDAFKFEGVDVTFGNCIFGSEITSEFEKVFVNSAVTFQNPIIVNTSLHIKDSEITTNNITVPSGTELFFESVSSDPEFSCKMEGNLTVINCTFNNINLDATSFESLEIENSQFFLPFQANFSVDSLSLNQTAILNFNVSTDKFDLFNDISLWMSNIYVQNEFYMDVDGTNANRISGDMGQSSVNLLLDSIYFNRSLELYSLNFSVTTNTINLTTKLTVFLLDGCYLSIDANETVFENLTLVNSNIQSNNSIKANHLRFVEQPNPILLLPKFKISETFVYPNGFELNNMEIVFESDCNMDFNKTITFTNVSLVNDGGIMNFTNQSISFFNSQIVNHKFLNIHTEFSNSENFGIENLYKLSFTPPLGMQNERTRSQGDPYSFWFSGNVYNEGEIVFNGDMNIEGTLVMNSSSSNVSFSADTSIIVQNFNFWDGSFEGNSKMINLEITKTLICQNGIFHSINLTYDTGIFTNGSFSIVYSGVGSTKTFLDTSFLELNSSLFTVGTSFQISDYGEAISGDLNSLIINNGDFISLSGVSGVSIENYGFFQVNYSSCTFGNFTNNGNVYFDGNVTVMSPFQNLENVILTNHFTESSYENSFNSSFQNSGYLEIRASIAFSGSFSSSSGSTILVKVWSLVKTPIIFKSTGASLTGFLEVSFIDSLSGLKLDDIVTIIRSEDSSMMITELEYLDQTHKFEPNATSSAIEFIFKGCDAGFYASDLFSECQPCGLGQHASTRGHTICDDCPEGSYANETGTIFCTPCERGSFVNSLRAQSCKPCYVGTAINDTGSSFCIECKSGYYADVEGLSECLTCSMGHQTTSSSTCDACPSGTYNSKPASSCDICPSGTYSHSGQTSCTPCEKNFYQNNIGQGSCKSCPINTVTHSDRSSSILECVCKLGMWGNPGEDCKECPKGGICEYEGITEPEVKPGYWADADLNFYQCDPVEACPGGSKETCNTKLGYQGAICSECAPGFYKLSSRCYRCPTNAKKRLIVAGLLFFLFVIALVIIAKSKARSYFGSLSISFAFFQILSTLPKMKIEWPSKIQSLLDNLTFFNFNIDLVAPECSVSTSYTTKWLAVMFAPLVILVTFTVLFIIVTLHSMIIRKCGAKFSRKFPRFCSKPSKQTTNKYVYPFSWIKFQISKLFTHGNSSTQKLFSSFLNAFVAFLFLVYLFLLQWVFSLFSCTKQSEGVYTLDADPAYRCYNDPWWKKMIIPGAIFGVVYVIGIPIFIVFMLVYHSKNYNEEMFDLRLSLLTSRFRKEWFFWELIVMARKLLFVFTLLYFNFATDFQIRLLIIVLLVAITLQAAFEPYDTKSRNRAEMALLCILEVVMLSSFVFVSDEDNSTKTKNIIENIIIAFIWIAIFVAFFVVLTEIKERVHQKQKQIKLEEKKEENEDQLQIYQESAIIQFLNKKPSFHFILEWFGKVSHKKVTKFAKVINQFDEVLQKNSIEFPEEKYLKIWHHLVENEFKDWYEQNATIHEKLLFAQLIDSLFKYIYSRGDNPIQRWRSNTQKTVPLKKKEDL
ncbi:g protein-coupled receptor-related [Anaeramoeba ignava]|uniref:G protein-coupled receptor-related n=1 Tax=Anaeramoeba ignava TaxID=1746090 RepID=A0A9Q0L916_ANAIG|nr:g protein-coupled receptor-related [Anaeramoeba ignava]